MKKILVIIGEILLSLVIIVCIRAILGLLIPAHREIMQLIIYLVGMLSGAVIVNFNREKK